MKLKIEVLLLLIALALEAALIATLAQTFAGTAVPRIESKEISSF
jgi:hypothetical protein